MTKKITRKRADHVIGTIAVSMIVIGLGVTMINVVGFYGLLFMLLASAVPVLFVVFLIQGPKALEYIWNKYIATEDNLND